MRLAALIEIVPTGDGILPADVVTQAYRASVFAPVVLVFADGLLERVERLLDPLVPQFPRGIPGVRYVSAEDHAAIAHYARVADVVRIVSPHLQALVGDGTSEVALPRGIATPASVLVADLPRVATA